MWMQPPVHATSCTVFRLHVTFVKVLWYMYMRNKGSVPALLTNSCISTCQLYNDSDDILQTNRQQYMAVCTSCQDQSAFHCNISLQVVKKPLLYLISSARLAGIDVTYSALNCNPEPRAVAHGSTLHKQSEGTYRQQCTCGPWDARTWTRTQTRTAGYRSAPGWQASIVNTQSNMLHDKVTKSYNDTTGGRGGETLRSGRGPERRGPATGGQPLEKHKV